MDDATIVPVSAKTTGTHKWNPISVTCDSVIVRGGYNTSREPANSITLDDSLQAPGAIRTFVELDKNARWFLKGVGGPKTLKGDLKSVEVLTMLRSKLKDRIAAPGAAVAAPVLSDAVVEPIADIDPMDELDAITSAQPKPLKYRKLSTYDRRALVETLTVPTRPICTGRGDGATTTIRVYQTLASRSNARLYLRTDCIDWLLAYAADELHCQGVIAPCPVPQSRVGNRSEVAGLQLEWSFASQAWACEFVDGPLLGTTRRFPVRDLTKAQFAEMRTGNKINACWSRASPAEKRMATMAVALEWASSVAARVDAQSCDGPPASQVAAVAVDDACLAVAGA